MYIYISLSLISTDIQVLKQRQEKKAQRERDAFNKELATYKEKISTLEGRLAREKDSFKSLTLVNLWGNYGY